MNPLSAADQALIAQLEQITPGNGYLTDVGMRVHAKWYQALLGDKNTRYPCIALQPDECPVPLKGAGRWLFYLGRRIVALVDPLYQGDALALMNELTVDLARCLHTEDGERVPWASEGLNKVVVKTIHQMLPDREVPVCTVSIPVLMHVIVPGE